jgi:thiosulfate/3-mercaptopyruvate sulfurtransferase
MASFGPLVTTKWLADHLKDPDVKVIDGSWRMPGTGNAIDDYNKRHIPGAVFFDIDEIADKSFALPHMLPPQDLFERAVGDMGMTENDSVVVYDDKGLFSAARVWWTFRAMGHRNVAVLDGGLPKWLAEDRPVTADVTKPLKVPYNANPEPAMCVTADDVRNALLMKTASVADARSAGRFQAEAPEPRAGLRSGAMPGAVNTPFDSLINEDGTMKPPEALRAVFVNAGANLTKPVITTCGSGVTAAVLCLALERIGHSSHRLYDGSWAEWGDDRNDPSLFPVTAGGKVEQ